MIQCDQNSQYHGISLLNLSRAALYLLWKELQSQTTIFLSGVERVRQGCARQGKGLLVYGFVQMFPKRTERMACFSSLVLSGSLSLIPRKLMLGVDGWAKLWGWAKQQPLTCWRTFWRSWQLMGCRKAQWVFQRRSLLRWWNSSSEMPFLAVYFSASMNRILSQTRVRQEATTSLSSYSFKPAKQIRLPRLCAVSMMYRNCGAIRYSSSKRCTPRSGLASQQAAISLRRDWMGTPSALARSTKMGSVSAKTLCSRASSSWPMKLLGFFFLSMSRGSLLPWQTLWFMYSRLRALRMPSRWEESMLSSTLRFLMSRPSKKAWTDSRDARTCGTWTSDPRLFLPEFRFRLSSQREEERKDSQAFYRVEKRWADLIIPPIIIDLQLNQNSLKSHWAWLMAKPWKNVHYYFLEGEFYVRGGTKIFISPMGNSMDIK